MTAAGLKNLARIVEKYNCSTMVIQHETHYTDQEGTTINWELEITPSDKNGFYDVMTLHLFDYFIFDYDEHTEDSEEYVTIYLKGAGQKDIGTIQIGKDYISIKGD